MKKRLTGIAAAAVAAALLAAPSTEAYPDSRVETVTRPDFGLLINPPLRRHKRHRPDGPGGQGPWTPPGGHTPPPNDGPLRDVALVDCSDARSPNDINRALASLAPGGTLILRTANDQGCLDSVRITRPVTIQGDGGQLWSPRGGRRPYRPLMDQRTDDNPADGADADPMDAEDDDGGRGGRTSTTTVRRDDFVGLAAHLKTRPGQVCIDIAPGAGKVVLRNLVIDQAQGGGAPCVYAANADLRIENSIIRYAGDSSAIYVEGGSLSISQDSLVDASTFDRAVYVERSRVSIRDFTLTGEPAIGIELVGPAKDSDIADVEFFSRAQAPVFSTPSVGLVISAANGLGELDITRARICGFGIGIWQQGANDTRIRRSHVCRSVKGIVAAGGDISVDHTAVGASLLGVQVGAAHRADLNNLTIYGASAYDIYREPGSIQPGGAGNLFYSGPNTYCRTVEVDQRHGDWNRYKRMRRRTGPLYFIPDFDKGGGVCVNPGELDPSWQAYERRLGYHDDGFYRMEPWNPELLYHLRFEGWDPGGHRLAGAQR